jgi:hypothetical protein
MLLKHFSSPLTTGKNKLERLSIPFQHYLLVRPVACSIQMITNVIGDFTGVNYDQSSIKRLQSYMTLLEMLILLLE